MLDDEDEAAIGLLGREPELQFVRLAAAYNEQKIEIARLRTALGNIERFGHGHGHGRGYTCATMSADALSQDTDKA